MTSEVLTESLRWGEWSTIYAPPSACTVHGPEGSSLKLCVEYKSLLRFARYNLILIEWTLGTVSRFSHVLWAHPCYRLCIFFLLWRNTEYFFDFAIIRFSRHECSPSEKRHNLNADTDAEIRMPYVLFITVISYATYIHLSLFYFSIKYIYCHSFFLFLFNLTYNDYELILLTLSAIYVFCSVDNNEKIKILLD